GKDEASTRDEHPGPTRTLVSEVDRELARARPGEEVGNREQVEKALAREPPPADDRLVLHHGDVGGRTAEGGEPQSQEHRCHLPEWQGRGFRPGWRSHRRSIWQAR